MKLHQIMFEPKVMIVEPGQTGKGDFLIESSKGKVYRRVGECQIPIAILGKGDIFGEMALVDNTTFG